MSDTDKMLLIVAVFSWLALGIVVVIGETGSEPLFRRRKR